MLTLFQPVSYKKGALLAIGATAFWKCCSFANSILIALYFGTRAGTDVYFYLIMLIGFGVSFLQKMNTSVLVPEALRAEEEHPGHGRRLLNAFMWLYAVLGLAVCALGVYLPVQSGAFLSRFSAAELARHENLLCAAFILFATNLWVAYLTNILEMYKRFGSALLTPLNAVLPLLALLLGGRTAGIISMIYGFLAANAVQLGCFLYVLRKELNWNFTPGLERFRAGFHKNLLANQLLEAAGLLNSLLPVYLISGLSTGLVSALNYAKQLADSPTEIITNRICAVNKIQLAEDSSRGEEDAFNAHFLQTGRLLAFILSPLAVFTCFYAQDIIELFFRRGHFTFQSAQDAAAFLRPLILMMWILIPVSLQTNALAAARKMKESFPYLLFSNLVFTAAVVWTVKRWGAFAYPYTQIACCVLGFAVNGFLFAKHFPQVRYGQSLKDGARLLALNVIALVPAAAVSAWIKTQSPFWELAAAGPVFLIALGLLTAYSGDLRLFWTAVSSKRFFKKLF